MRGLLRDGLGATQAAGLSGGLFVAPWLAMFLVGLVPMGAPPLEVLTPPDRQVVWAQLSLDEPGDEQGLADVPEEPPPVEPAVDAPELAHADDAPPPDPVATPDPQRAGPSPEAEAEATADVLASTDAEGDAAEEGAPQDGLATAVVGLRGAHVARNLKGRALGMSQEQIQRAKRRRKGRDCTKPHPQVGVGADGITEIDRDLVDQYTRNLNSFMELGYSEPYDDEGLKGWYIGGFGCTSPVHKAGFRRKDVLLTVNGKKTRNWVGVFLLYKKLKNKDDFEVNLVRDGEPVTLRFRVVDS